MPISPFNDTTSARSGWVQPRPRQPRGQPSAGQFLRLSYMRRPALGRPGRSRPLGPGGGAAPAHGRVRLDPPRAHGWARSGPTSCDRGRRLRSPGAGDSRTRRMAHTGYAWTCGSGPRSDLQVCQRGEQVTQTALSIGAPAPDFEAADQDGHPWRLSEGLRQSAQVLVFYRGDW